jgi:DNA polymerase-3 subunit delta'
LSFENIIGNEKNKEFLNKIIDSNSTVHSYMFEGIEGIGKSIFAKEFAKMLLCIGNDKKNCARCKSCLEFVNSNNPDYVQIDSDGKIIKIEQIRQMQEKILEKPIVSSKKVYVINDADLMTKEAQNCLLKTLEEPPEFVIIILVLANESKILNTVKSRCMRIFFSKLKDEELKKYACREYNEAEIKEGMIKNASGSISKFIKIKANFDEYENLEELVKKLKTDNILDIINNADVLYKNKDKIEDLLDYMTTVFYNWLTKEDNIKYINIIKIIEIVKRKLKSNSNFDMSIDYLIFNIWEEINEDSNRSQV